ncbi:hypothetical protein TraAM80_04525 [Trypanosoma rangeli]|uniref:Uncharacterized protein n=1 Tax=Trypanosoma rangeli TaxID=5698 RepID=A0A422NJ54_TRYRA|nr:uncharacterized protein TraAM80_04525 [Trypanosoma rangeli]RNF05485.1 hypothetical protein TraAM80_04525 [Trypanosoma rangeli]|eukprot:RNF05485.1 hypothetical protein TraAM80_04525 [Trypanosoma rangeli]
MICALTVVVLGLLVAGQSDAFEIVPARVSHLKADHNVWKPSGAVILRGGVACARAYQESCPQCPQELTAVCTFDGGNTFSLQQTQYPFCGNRGVVINNSLFCPASLKQVNSSVLNVNLISYDSLDSLVETPNVDKMWTFHYWPGEEVTDIKFKGNTLAFPEEHLYLMNAVVVRGNYTVDHVLFNSSDGQIWKVQSRIPLDVADKTVLSQTGQHQIAVSAYTKGEHRIVYSFYKGTRWSTTRHLNTSFPPATLYVGNGIMIQTGLSNHSASLELGGFDETNLKRKVFRLTELYANKTEHNQLPQPFTTECTEEASCLTSSHVALMSLQPGHITALFDFVSNELQRKIVAAVSMVVDDSEEREAIILAKKKAEENAKLMEELKRKIQHENKERKRKEREEKRREEKKRRDRFLKADMVNIEVATSRTREDGEMIVVREVVEEMIDIEKNVFFW